MRLSRLLAACGVTLLGGFAAAAVIPRDLTKQLELIEAASGGAVVHGTIVASETVSLPELIDVPMTRLTLEVQRAVVPENAPTTVVAYFYGAGEERLSISPSPDEVKVGEQVVAFLRPDARLRAIDAKAFMIDSFAEVLRTQSNRKGAVVVIGEGAGSAVEGNVALDQFVTATRQAFKVVAAEKASKGGK